MTHKFKKFLLNSKILLGIIIGVLVAAIGVIAFSGSQILNDISEGGLGKISPDPINVIPIQVELETFEVLSVTPEEAQIKIDFKITNPNYKSVLLQLIKYDLYAADKRVTISQIGDRPEGAIEGSNYYTILSNNPQIIGETITLKNTGTDPEFWSALQSNTISWKIKGEANFNLSSMTAGHENIASFEFSP
jgi:LEA14-like dessication related protein